MAATTNIRPSRRSEICLRGHLLQGANLRILPRTGQRRCRQCDRMHHANHYNRAKAEGRPWARSRTNSREEQRRALLKAAIAQLLETHDEEEGDIIDQLPAIAEATGSTFDQARFELQWQLGIFDLPEEER